MPLPDASPRRSLRALAFAGLLLGAGAQLEARAQTGEFPVNTYTTGLQQFARVAADADGDFVVVWEGAGETDAGGIHARRFAADGTPLGAAFQVNAPANAAAFQRQPDVAMAPDGRFVVVWNSAAPGSDETEVFARRFDAAGAPLDAEEVRVNTHTADYQQSPVVAMDADGDFVVVWQSEGQDGSVGGVYAQRYAAAGVPQGGEFRVNTTTESGQGTPAVAMDQAGAFVVAWISFGQDGDHFGIFAQRYSAAGTAQGAEFQVNTTAAGPQRLPDVAMAPGGFVVAWQSEGQDGDGEGVYLRRYDADGDAIGGEARVNVTTAGDQYRPVVAMDASGRLAVVWQSDGQDGSGGGVYRRTFDAAGVSTSAEGLVNAFTTGDQAWPAVAMAGADGRFVAAWESAGQDGSGPGVYARVLALPPGPQDPEFQANAFVDGDQSAAAVARDADGDVVVAWTSDDQDGSGQGVYARRFTADGSPDGPEFRVNEHTPFNQSGPAVAMNPDGAFVVAWTSSGQDGSSFGVYARRYGRTGLPLGGEFRVNVTTEGTQSSPDVAMGAGGAFVVVWTGDTAEGDGVFARAYDAEGAPVSGEVAVNTFTAGDQLFPSVAASPGRFVVTWQSSGQDADGSSGIYARRFTSAGVPVGGEILVPEVPAGSQGRPVVGADGAGAFAVAYTGPGAGGGGNGLYVRRFSADGAPLGGEVRVDVAPAGEFTNFPAIAVDADGRFVVAWEQGDPNVGGEVFVRRFAADGAPATAPARANVYLAGLQGRPDVAADAVGGFVAVWESRGGQDGDGTGVFGRVYDPLGPPHGPQPPEFQANTSAPLDQLFPSVARAPGGEFVVVWQSDAGDGSGPGVFGQRYDADGTPQDDEFQVNFYPVDGQREPVVGMDDDGDFVVAWYSEGQDGGGTGVYARRYAANGASAGVPFRVNVTTAGSQSAPRLAVAPDGSFVVVWEGNGLGDAAGIYARLYDAAGDPLTGELLANATTAGQQERPAVAMDADGAFVVAWASIGQDGDGWGIFARRFAADGAPAGSEFQVNQTTDNQQRDAVVARAADGRFAVAWHSFGQDGSLRGVYARRYGASGIAFGGEFRVNTETAGYQFGPALAYDPDGGLVATWHSEDQDGDGYGVYARRYDNDGAEAGAEFRVNVFTAGDQTSPALAVDGGGSAVVVWTSELQDGSGAGVYGRILPGPNRPYASDFTYDADGEHVVNTATFNDQHVAAVATAADGRFVVVWQSEGAGGTYDVFARRYAATGVPGAPFRVHPLTAGDQRHPAVAMDAAGRFVVAWASSGQDGSGYGVYARRYAADGTTLGEEFRVNTFTAGSQASPSVAMTADGAFVVVWSSDGQDGDQGGLFGQRYTATGEPAGGEFAVNTTTAGSQAIPSVAMDAAGAFAVAWQSLGQDGDGWGIFARRFGADGAPLGGEIAVNETTALGQVGASVAMGAGGFVVAWETVVPTVDNQIEQVYARRFDAAGAPVGGEFLVGAGTEAFDETPTVEMDSTGAFLVAWQSEGSDGTDLTGEEILARRYAADGTPQGAAVQVNVYEDAFQRNPDVAFGPDGRLVVVYDSYELDGSGWAVAARLYGYVTTFSSTSAELQGAEGWRLLAAPAAGATLDDLLGPLWTQGYPGADYEGGGASVLRYDEAATGPVDAGYLAPVSQSGAAGTGAGYLVYVYADPDFDGPEEPGFPQALFVGGVAPAGPVALPVTYTDSGAPDADGWNLVGNPYRETIDWDLAVRADVSASVYAFDPALPGYRVWNGLAGDLPNGRLTAFQGFWVKAMDTDASGTVVPGLTVPEDAQVPGTGTFYGRAGDGEPEEPAAPVVALTLLREDGGFGREAHAFLAFPDHAAPGPDALDAYALEPAAADRLTLYTRSGSDPARAVQALPPTGRHDLTLGFEAAEAGAAAGGRFTLSWPDFSLPEGWRASLHDAATGREVDLRTATGYTFTHDAVARDPENRQAPARRVLDADGRARAEHGGAPVPAAPSPRPVGSAHGAASAERFRLVVEAAAVATEAGGGPVVLALVVAPNPARAGAVVRYALPASGTVRLAVYDALGREVAVLHDGEGAVGHHEVRLDAGALAAGVYLLRLQAGDEALIRRLTVLR